MWDVPSPAVIGRPFRIKVGVTCAAGCTLEALEVEVRDMAGTRLARGQLGAAPWPGTYALYWTELEVPGPVSQGVHTWQIASREAGGHAFDGCFTATVVTRPEFHLSITVVDAEDGSPGGGAHVRVGPYLAATDPHGHASITVAPGTYEVIVWKVGYLAAPVAIAVSDHTSVRIDLHRVAESPEPYWM